MAEQSTGMISMSKYRQLNVPPDRRRVLSGLQPSGKLHLGNYFGAIKQLVEAQEFPGERFTFIADYHSMTTLADGPQRQANTLDAAIDYLALGLDPAKSVIFRQSDVPEVHELAWMLACVTNTGLLEKAHSYKDKIAKGIEASVGLFTYPILMAADILIYRSHFVPVGDDQVQHLEMTRDMAGKFNRAYGEVFPLPQAVMVEAGAKVPGIDGGKMSKSYGNTIDIFAEGNALKKPVMAIVTDSKPLEAPKDTSTCTVFALYSLFATDDEKAELKAKYHAGGMGYGEAKKMLLAKITDYFAAARARRKELAADPGYVESVLRDGAAKARAEADKTMRLARQAAGF